MKKLIYYLLIMLAFVLAPVSLSAADWTADEVQNAFGNFVALVAAIPLAVEALKSILKPTQRLWVQALSWGTGIAMTMLGWWLGFGFLAGMLWWHALIVGLFASLSANGVWDTGLYEAILKAIKIIKT